MHQWIHVDEQPSQPKLLYQLYRHVDPPSKKLCWLWVLLRTQNLILYHRLEANSNLQYNIIIFNTMDLNDLLPNAIKFRTRFSSQSSSRERHLIMTMAEIQKERLLYSLFLFLVHTNRFVEALAKAKQSFDTNLTTGRWEVAIENTCEH